MLTLLELVYSRENRRATLSLPYIISYFMHSAIVTHSSLQHQLTEQKYTHLKSAFPVPSMCDEPQTIPGVLVPLPVTPFSPKVQVVYINVQILPALLQ